MKDNKSTASKGGGRVRRFLLIFWLLLCLAGAAYLGYLGVMELLETQQGSDFYAELALSVEDAANEKDVEPTVEQSGPEATEEPSETSDDQDAASPSEIDFDALWQSCPDVVGWIRLEDSVIDYPVVLGEDNDFYLHHLPDGTENKAGSIMMDRANTGTFREDVTVLHGHHMRGGSMFGRLADYASEEYFQGHRVVRLFTPDGDYDVAVFAAYTVNGYTFGYPTSFEDEATFDQFVRKAVSATPYETGVEVEYGDHILLLSTCAYSFEGARYVVMGKILESEAE